MAITNNTFKQYSVPNTTVQLSNIGNGSNASLLKLGSSSVMNGTSFYQGVSTKAATSGAETAMLLSNISAGVGIAGATVGLGSAVKTLFNIGSGSKSNAGIENTAKAGAQEVTKAIADYTKTGDVKSLTVAASKDAACKAQATQIDGMVPAQELVISGLNGELKTLQDSGKQADATLDQLGQTEDTAKGTSDADEQAYNNTPAEPAVTKKLAKAKMEASKKAYEAAKKAREKQEGVCKNIEKQTTKKEAEITKAQTKLTEIKTTAAKLKAANTQWANAINQAKQILDKAGVKTETEDNSVAKKQEEAKEIAELSTEAKTLGVTFDEKKVTKDELKKLVADAKTKKEKEEKPKA